ncbi:ATP-binding protein [Streptomyces chartreusis]|uniref:ATP-binding protein n=1 Tax=Streptomyces chartreusis TaxID=1969 RepID=UPI0036BF25CB
MGTLDFVAGKENVICLGPPGTGKTHLATGLGIRACQADHRVAFATAAQWVTRLAEAHQAGRLVDELTLVRPPVRTGRDRGGAVQVNRPGRSDSVLHIDVGRCRIHRPGSGPGGKPVPALHLNDQAENGKA